MFFKNLCVELSQLPQVEAIALGGSRAGNAFDKNSDYDLYVYVNSLPDEKFRKEILEKYCSYIEAGNSFWELEDDCTLKDGVDIDILYRDLENFGKGIASVVEGFESHNGYTTCMWHNLLNCKILFDRNNKLTDLQSKYNVSYPEELKENIIGRNMKLLHGFLPSYDRQILKAIKRNDLVSVNHRTAAFLESYFDIIFAMNELTHPGEKREVPYALKHAKKLPENFESDLEELFNSMFDKNSISSVPKILDRIISALKAVI